ncbi:glycosyltransferase [Sphingomonas flavalba]|uniref:glycosyltransferase n=1 Tax=Sphingomonas flavalba TaxID=2559804 RepID=UPI0039DFC61C
MTALTPTIVRPVVLVSVDHYLPGYKAGGPIRSIANMVAQLGDTFHFHIVAVDRDLGDDHGYPGVVPNTWTDCGKARVFYRTPGRAGWRALLDSLADIDFDLLYLNSFFSTDATLRFLAYHRLGRIARRPVLLATRGELSRGALALKAPKKRAFIAIAKVLGLYRGVTFHASSDYEAEDIKNIFGPSICISVASNLSTNEKLAELKHNSDNYRRIRGVFLSRISQKKNLLGAIDILDDPGVPDMDLDIYGTLENKAYWEACQENIAKLHGNVRVKYCGALHHDAVLDTLSGYDFFFFPTLGENFGHVIAEALAVGLPVLISDQTPWRDLQAKGVGADLPLDQPEAFRAWIRQFSAYTPVERQAIRLAAQAFGRSRQLADEDRQANCAMLRAAMAQNP